ncbi:MAG: acyl-ACP desaturase [Gordonia sp. (in: high G+C Gram-positive bacteria)]|uniref:acyl-ACP desaturase n=1 Tax=Gordonia sp. (in: high G+C Gram-positive bacteria) TaxID=84139 RepID=UPI0039E5D5F6
MKKLSQLELLQELSPAAEEEVNRHLKVARDWNPHDYVPWDEGKNYAPLGGDDYNEEHGELSEVAKAAMITNLLTEDNLPSYHRVIAENFSMDSAWGHWVGRWTAEEDRHGIVMRDYLVVTRGVDPVALEEARMIHMTNGYSPELAAGPDRIAEMQEHAEELGLLHSVAYVTFQELATKVSHRNTGRACNDPIANKMLQRIAADENLHMTFYRNITGAAMDLAPDQTLRAVTDIVTNFQMPGAGMPNFRRHGVLMAKHGIYDLRQHKDEVVMPVLKKWDVFGRDDFGPEGEKTREELADFLEQLEKDVVRFEEMRDRSLAREAAKAEKAAKAS